MGEIEFIPVDDGCDPLECYRFVEVFFDVGFGALTFIGISVGGAKENSFPVIRWSCRSRMDR